MGPSLIKRLYRVLPSSIRRTAIASRMKLLGQSYLLPHDWVYDSEYYSTNRLETAARSASIIAEAIRRDLNPGRVIDVGCGTGDVLLALRDKGVEVAGLERSLAALEVCHSRGLPVSSFDLEDEELADDTVYDVVMSMEVAEHLPARVADRYVNLLARLGRVIVFTAAPPGQGGTDHINEQPASYWHEKFARHGFRPDTELTRCWQREWRETGKVSGWYHVNLMVFRRAALGRASHTRSE